MSCNSLSIICLSANKYDIVKSCVISDISIDCIISLIIVLDISLLLFNWYFILTDIFIVLVLSDMS